MTKIACPNCGKLNSSKREECRFCHAPLNKERILTPTEENGEDHSLPKPVTESEATTHAGAGSGSTHDLEQSVPDWVKETEAGNAEILEARPEEPGKDEISQLTNSIITPSQGSSEEPVKKTDDEWLNTLLADAGAIDSLQSEPQEEPNKTQIPAPPPEIDSPASEEDKEEEKALSSPFIEKPDWLTELEASSKIKLEGGMFASEQEKIQSASVDIPDEKAPDSNEQPDWLLKAETEPHEEIAQNADGPIAPAELPGWLEALQPTGSLSPTGPIEDVSTADLVTAGPLMGLRGVISAHPSALRAQKPPTYSIKVRVTEEQQARVKLMEELLADEEKSNPVTSERVITSRYIFRLIVAVVLLLPIIWMIISNHQPSSPPQPGSIPGMVDFIEHIQAIPANTPVLIAFDYEAAFSSELNIAIVNVVEQLMKKSSYLTVASTNPSGPALAESILVNASTNVYGSGNTYPNYADLGYIPGGTMGLLGLATSPKSVLPYSLEGINVWGLPPLQDISTVKDFSVVIVITNDADTARVWIEQVGTQLNESDIPLLFISSIQSTPLILPYFKAIPSQVQGVISGLTGSIAYARAVGNYQESGILDAYSAGITISVLIIIIGTIVSIAYKVISAGKKEEA